MKYLYSFFLLLCLTSCQKPKPLSYEAGLERCSQLKAEKEKAHPGEVFMNSPEGMIGAQIPDFEATTLDGSKINRASLLGKVSVLNFWFTSCAPCVAEIPGLNAVVQKFGIGQVNYLAIGRENKEDMEAFLLEHPWSFQQIPDGMALDKAVFKLQWGYPTTFVLNKNAEIVQVFSGGATDSNAVDAVQRNLIPAIEKALR
jgi:thiol-disulfide isomerase/thioredoxin